ncbi:3' terminal RNA ribose 2'-O-methyltransferase Hen1, partial [Frankia sp. AvcI1]
MLLTLATTHPPARDLGFLLHKHPDRVHSFTEPMGTAHVFYPEATDDRCTVALLLEVDPVGLVRGRKGAPGEGFALAQYVNDRPYAASSMLAMALKDVFRTAMTGRCNARPELAAAAIPLEIHVPAVASRAGSDLPRRLFEPLGWRVAVATGPLDPDVPAWGESPYLDVRLSGTLRLAEALNHLYVLLPVLDDAKHYRVGGDEVDKLLRAGADWLASHPESDLIARRYLSHRRELTRSALARLAEVDDTEPEQLDDALGGAVELDPPDRPLSLAEQRRGAVLAVLRSHAARRVGDLGCGEGLLARELLGERTIEHVLAADVSARALRIAGSRLGVERMSDAQRARLTLIQSSLTYRDERLTGLDAAVLMEVVEHVDP